MSSDLNGSERKSTGVAARIIRGDSRRMTALADGSVDLVVTSPPYWQIKDYGTIEQIGFQQSLHEYLFDLARVWGECARVLRPGRRLCVNIGDQFARALIYGRYKIIPLHAEVIAQAAAVGLDYLGAIIWQKKTTMNTTGGAVVMGSFPYPPNGIVELDYEYILLFKKPGKPTHPTPEQKAASQMTTEEWKTYFAGHWHFGGAKQIEHQAMFPDELPHRIIRMFSFMGETVLDPFMGSGTTAKVALNLERNVIGYEINPDFLPLIREKIGLLPACFEEQENTVAAHPPPLSYVPITEDARPVRDVTQFRFGQQETYKITEIIDARTLRMDTGLTVELLGITVPPESVARTTTYLERYLVGKQVIVRFEKPDSDPQKPIPVYLQLTNKLFVNRKMIEAGLAVADRSVHHRFSAKFIAAEQKAESKSRVDILRVDLAAYS